jgi:ABC-type Fe3+-hydroxamate transport system substrate-binding protein
VDEALRSMHRLFVDVLDVGEPDWLLTAADQWSRPSPRPELRVVRPIWRDPWMVVGARTFTGDVLSRLGLMNLFGDDEERYRRVELERLQAMGADVVLLPDEPYVFSRENGPEAFPGVRTVLLSGRDLTWYGPSLATARPRLLQQIRQA